MTRCISLTSEWKWKWQEQWHNGVWCGNCCNEKCRRMSDLLALGMSDDHNCPLTAHQMIYPASQRTLCCLWSAVHSLPTRWSVEDWDSADPAWYVRVMTINEFLSLNNVCFKRTWNAICLGNEWRGRPSNDPSGFALCCHTLWGEDREHTPWTDCTSCSCEAGDERTGQMGMERWGVEGEKREESRERSCVISLIRTRRMGIIFLHEARNRGRQILTNRYDRHGILDWIRDQRVVRSNCHTCRQILCESRQHYSGILCKFVHEREKSVG